MKEVDYKDVFDINFLSDIKFSPDGAHASFVVSKGLYDENKYKSNIYIYTESTGNIRKLTSVDSERNPVWLDNENIIFPGARTEADKELQKKGMPETIYNKINIHGGEAEKYFAVPAKCSSIAKINDDAFLVLAAFDNYAPDLTGLSKEEAQKTLKEMSEANSAYKIFDEIPFWFNGQGVTNKKRARLYLFDKSANSLTPISEPLLNVESFYYEKDSGRVVYSGVSYKDKMELKSQVYIYCLNTKANEKISLSGDYNIDYTWIINNELVFYGIPYGDKIPFHNFSLYKTPVTGGEPVRIGDGDFSMGNSVGSDCKYGGGAPVKVINNRLYYISTRGCSSGLFTIDENGVEKRVSGDVSGTVDSFDVRDGRAVFTGVRNKGLQEIYCAYNGEERTLSDFNGGWLKEHFISYPEHFEFLNRDGVTLDGFVIKPVNYDEAKKYPAICDIHGGPKAAYGDVLFHEMQVWASRGYFVFFTNPRGSDGRGSEFADIQGDRFLEFDYNDMMDFTDKVLEKYPAIDSQRVGVTGGSYGGLMVNWLVGHTHRFKAAATQRSISNYISKCLTTDIGYYHNLNQIGTDPWSGIETFWDKSPLKYAPNCKTPLLFIHSDEDYRCYMADALQMFTALKMIGVEARMCLFHGENHDLSRSGKPKNRVKRLDEITSWMDKYLKAE